MADVEKVPDAVAEEAPEAEVPAAETPAEGDAPAAESDAAPAEDGAPTGTAYGLSPLYSHAWVKTISSLSALCFLTTYAMQTLVPLFDCSHIFAPFASSISTAFFPFILMLVALT
eukprot:gene7134-240_t